jgi:hypothetical protein
MFVMSYASEEEAARRHTTDINEIVGNGLGAAEQAAGH